MYRFAIIDGETGKRFATIVAISLVAAQKIAFTKYGTNVGVISTTLGTPRE